VDINVLDPCPLTDFFLNDAVRPSVSSSRDVCYNFLTSVVSLYFGPDVALKIFVSWPS
jgi:hypothetical protein